MWNIAKDMLWNSSTSADLFLEIRAVWRSSMWSSDD